jgi:3-methyl-2-oxobutanoate hydroxymethyltransferase
MNINELKNKQANREKLTMLTCYDFSTAKIMNQSDIDMILVGDSAAMVMHGETSTIPMDNDRMHAHVRAVVKGAPDKFVIADMPFLSFRQSIDTGMQTVRTLMQAGAHAIKLEAVDGHEALIKQIVESGIPVMGHVGLTPQFVNQFGGFKVQGKDQSSHDKILADALKLQQLGCFSVVLECVPADLAKQITAETDLITIGIGAGRAVDGQVLVMHDMLGYPSSFSPKFVRKYLDVEHLFKEAFNQYVRDVQQQEFPSDKESY